MDATQKVTETRTLLHAMRDLLSDFTRFAGIRGLGAFLLVFLGALVEGIGIILFIPFFTVIIDSQAAGPLGRFTSRLFASFSAETQFERLALLVGMFGILMVVRAFVIVARDVTTSRLEIAFIKDIRLRATRGVLSTPWNIVAGLRHSYVTQVLAMDIRRIGGATRTVVRDLVAIVMLLSQIALALVLEPVLASLALFLVIALALTVVPVVRDAHTFGKFSVRTNFALLTDMAQFMGALKLAIGQNLQGNFAREFEDTLTQLETEEIGFVRRRTIARLTVVTLSGLLGAIVLLIGITFTDVEPSILIALLLLFSRMSGPIMQLQGDAQTLAVALPAYERFRKLKEEFPERPAELGQAEAPLLPLTGAIVFRDVSYRHGDENGKHDAERGVQLLNLTIAPGTVVGVTGPSGAGKTTFADLLVGLYSPQDGEISIGDAPLVGPINASWRSQVGYAVQDPFLFHDTIRRNFLWANPKTDEAAIWDALRIVDADKLVRGMTRGLDTVVGERGSLLSGGERQRLCLARAILRTPRLLVLDEATNAIDVAAERVLFERLLGLVPRPTIVVIAHRWESLRTCDRILSFDNGRLIADLVVADPAERARYFHMLRDFAERDGPDVDQPELDEDDDC